MSHQEKQRIFDEYAKSKGFESWKALQVFTMTRLDILQNHIFAACDLLQAEQQKRIAEKVMMKNHDGSSKVNRHLKYFQNGADNIQIDKETITNPENKIQ